MEGPDSKTLEPYVSDVSMAYITSYGCSVTVGCWAFVFVSKTFTSHRFVSFQALPVIAQRMSDESVAVRDSAAWVIGRVCELMPHLVINEKFLDLVVTTLTQSLTVEPRVAANVCWVSNSFQQLLKERKLINAATYTVCVFL